MGTETITIVKIIKMTKSLDFNLFLSFIEFKISFLDKDSFIIHL